jgi:hypothetical protein
MGILVRLNDEEEQALFALPADARVCYILGLRPYMDFATGIVGDKRRVSYQSLMELLEYEPDRGSHLGALCRPSLEKVRNELSRCERAGLIERLPKFRRTDPLRLKMVLADFDGQIPPQEEPQRKPSGGTPKRCSVVGSANTLRSKVVMDFPSVDKANKRHSGAHKDEPHTSVLPFTTTTTTTTKNIYNASAADFLLPADWCPSVDTMMRLVGDEFVDPVFVDEYTTEFVIYWSVSGVAKGSWDAVFFRQCLQQWKHRRFSWSQR